MSDFVNLKKRSVTLPPGCKDLVDLLKVPKQKSPAIKIRERLAGLGRYVEMTINTKTSVAYLSVASLTNHVTFRLHNHKNQGGVLSARVEAETKTKEEAAVTAFLDRNGWKRPAGGEMPHVFLFPTLPIQLMRDIDPLPLDPTIITRLVTELFRECCGLTDTDELEVTFVEATLPPETFSGTHSKAD